MAADFHGNTTHFRSSFSISMFVPLPNDLPAHRMTDFTISLPIKMVKNIEKANHTI
jgi:hypothetical protein